MLITEQQIGRVLIIRFYRRYRQLPSGSAVHWSGRQRPDLVERRRLDWPNR